MKQLGDKIYSAFCMPGKNRLIEPMREWNKEVCLTMARNYRCIPRSAACACSKRDVVIRLAVPGTTPDGGSISAEETAQGKIG